MSKIKLLSLVLLSGMFFSNVVFAKAEPVSEPTVYTQDKPVAVVTSEQPEFVVKLKSNPTTGFSWVLRDYNMELLQAVSHQYQPATDNGIVGAGGFELWTFKVKPAGFIVPQQTAMRFVYTRPWESVENTTQLVFKVTTAQADKK
jgi:inhibitor of cysteine peptidase